MIFSKKSIDLRRVVITGVGLISSVGKNVPESWENIRNGKSGISRITRFDATDYYSKIAGEVKNYDPLEYFEKRDAKKMDPYIQFGMIAASEAVEDSAFVNASGLNPERAGVYIGSGIGGILTIENNNEILLERGPSRISPFFLTAAIANLASGQVSIKHNLKGPNLANVTACATSTHSIGDSFKMIQRGDADIMVAGGAEYPITRLGVGGFSAIKALSTRNDDPEKASRPFDKERDGFVVAEGAAVVVLEDLEHAVKRGAKIYSEVVGYGLTGDAFHVTAPDMEADGAVRTMRMAINDAEIDVKDVDHINAHGTSTPLNDKVETKAIRKLFGSHAEKINVCSTKSMTGHMLGATGGAEAIFSALAVRDNFIPPTVNQEVSDEECDLNYTPNKGVEREIRYALSNSFGFGGTNGTLLLKKFENK
ncbi:MAG: beta-ketoacyl-ACP synthase II [Acidobacteriota bacterium]